MLSTLRFILFTVFCLVLIFSAVLFTILNMYKPAVRAYLNGEFVGYFSSEQQFDEVYNDLVTEKQSIDPNVKVYLENEPSFEQSYIRESVLSEQNIYTNLRAKIKTEFTIYDVAVDGKVEMTFNTQDEANKYSEDLKQKVAKLKVEVKSEKVEQLGEMTTLERADNILNDIVDRNKPVYTPKTTITTKKAATTSTNATASANIANQASIQGGIWPTVSHYISSYYGWRWGTIHSGTDIAGKSGDPIYAYKSGLVTFAGWGGDYGNLVKVDHGNGISTWYGHCSKLLVAAGTEVAQGQTIALMGTTGNSTGNHLHFEVRINGVHVNSLPYIQGK